MSFRVKGIMAVGTDPFHLFGKGIIATTTPKKLGNGVNPRWPGADPLMSKILQDNAFPATALNDGRVRIQGDLGPLGKAACADVELLFKGNEKDLQCR
jgi:hypothetical protein